MPRYSDVLQRCREIVVNEFGNLFKETFGQIDNFILDQAEIALTNEERNHCFELMHELLLRQPECERVFRDELSRGFKNFAEGLAKPLRSHADPQEKEKLSLVGKEEYEVYLAYAGMLHNGNNRYAEQLFALNHRLAVVAGGVKLGEYNPALPGSPAQVGDALQTALEALAIPVQYKILIALVRECEDKVMRRADHIYEEYNNTLINAGILPNLSLEAIGYKPPRAPDDGAQSRSEALRRAADGGEKAAPKQVAQPVDKLGYVSHETGPESADDELGVDREIFQGIQDVLARRHPEPLSSPPPAEGTGGTNIPDFMAALKFMQASSQPVSQQEFATLSLESVKESFSDQLARLADLVKQQRVDAADSDIVDLVGMLFEFILNDNTLPDSVKALLSHLHTPILKVALLDRKFFFRGKHPSRRLLNAMTHAGALCNAEEHGEHGIFAKMQSIVDYITQNFEDDTQLFAEVLEDFNQFLENFSHRSKVVERRTVETAKGRERLREARQAVTREIVDRTWNRDIPKPVENLIMGSWANLLVLTQLRNGQDSEEWKWAMGVVDEVLWSIEPKATAAERAKVHDRLPAINDAIREGLTLIGDPEVNISNLLEELDACQRALLDGSPQQSADDRLGRRPPQAMAGKPPRAIWEDVEAELPEDREHPFLRDADPVLLAIVDILKSIKLGATFEFIDKKKQRKFRAKLSWFSPKTAYYIFVNQAGIQVAVKSLRTLAKEMQCGEAHIVPASRKPFMHRALETIHTLLSNPETSPAAASAHDR